MRGKHQNAFIKIHINLKCIGLVWALPVGFVLDAFQALHLFWARSLTKMESRLDEMENFSFPIIASKSSGSVTL